MRWRAKTLIFLGLGCVVFLSTAWKRLIKGISPKIPMLCFVLINSVLLNLFLCMDVAFLQVYIPTRQQSSSSDTSIFPLCRIKKKSQRHSLGCRSFSYAALSVWNSLPCKVRLSNTVTSFFLDLNIVND